MVQALVWVVLQIIVLEGDKCRQICSRNQEQEHQCHVHSGLLAMCRVVHYNTQLIVQHQAAAGHSTSNGWNISPGMYRTA